MAWVGEERSDRFWSSEARQDRLSVLNLAQTMRNEALKGELLVLCSTGVSVSERLVRHRPTAFKGCANKGSKVRTHLAFARATPIQSHNIHRTVYMELRWHVNCSAV